MVRHYVRKGGWGGSRAGSGNKPGQWEDQGGRATAAEAKRDRKEKRTHETMETKRRMDERWHKWSRKEVRASILLHIRAPAPHLTCVLLVRLCRCT